ncbi:uncharacterized protein LOC144365720 [Ictidomys tridecemlineatus]
MWIKKKRDPASRDPRVREIRTPGTARAREVGATERIYSQDPEPGSAATPGAEPRSGGGARAGPSLDAPRGRGSRGPGGAVASVAAAGEGLGVSASPAGPRRWPGGRDKEEEVSGLRAGSCAGRRGGGEHSPSPLLTAPASRGRAARSSQWGCGGGRARSGGWEEGRSRGLRAHPTHAPRSLRRWCARFSDPCVRGRVSWRLRIIPLVNWPTYNLVFLVSKRLVCRLLEALASLPPRAACEGSWRHVSLRREKGDPVPLVAPLPEGPPSRPSGCLSKPAPGPYRPHNPVITAALHFPLSAETKDHTLHLCSRQAPLRIQHILCISIRTQIVRLFGWKGFLNLSLVIQPCTPQRS